MNEPITRSEMYLAALGGEAVTPPEPITRMDMYMAYLNGMTDTYPEPITRTEQYLYKLCQNGMGGGGGVTIRNQNKTITQNGQYKADSGYTGLGTVTVNVPQEDPVLQDKTATQNGKYTADGGFDGLGTVTVAVPDPVLQDKTVTENGTVTADAGFDGLGVVTVNVEASGGGDTLMAVNNNTLTEYRDVSVKELRKYLFYGCSALETADFPNATNIGQGCFMESGIKRAYFPLAAGVGKEAFAKCKSLESVEILGSVGAGTAPSRFTNCTALKKAIVPNFLKLQGDFKGCTSLLAIDLSNTNGVYGGVASCPNLKVIVLRKTTCAALDSTGFAGTPYAEGGAGGYVLVRSDMITTYQEYTNWAAYYAYGTTTFLPVEDYTLDGTADGVLDWDKIDTLIASGVNE